MIDPEALRITRETMEGELPGRRYRFGLECARVKSDAARAGALGGSAFWSVFVDVCALEIEAAGERAWRILHRTIITTGAEFSSDLAESLKRCFDEIFSRYCCAEPQDFFRCEMDNSKMGPYLISSAAHRLEERIVGARRVVYAEIELFPSTHAYSLKGSCLTP